MAEVQYVWIYNPISHQLQMTIDPNSIPGLIVTSDVPARPGNIPVFGPGNKIEDSGYYLNQNGQIVKISGGYVA